MCSSPFSPDECPRFCPRGTSPLAFDIAGEFDSGVALEQGASVDSGVLGTFTPFVDPSSA